MTAPELRKTFLKYFESKNHKIIGSASLIPDNDPTVLFTTAGMHPLVPYLMGEKHPEGKRLTSVQKCIRTGDIDEVGDATHHTFFEMLGNWSLGDYFKKETIEFSWEFLTEVLGIKKEKLAVTVFAGDQNVPRDEESAEIWKKIGVNKIGYLGKKDNWWGPAGQTGPCGPDTEIFYWTGTESAPNNFDPEDTRWVELWNDVIMQYNKTADGKYEPLKQKNIDTGMGFERTLAVLNGFDDNYLTELWQPIIKKIEDLSGKKYKFEK
ncbi:alanine--tRNA ligase, partial [Candidatus Parcubacteria bacterium]|nr:alanine--tRNA ligase [Candidatus Parcubacteria bacterium]